MCTHACIEFIRANLCLEDVQRCAVIEVGALDVNGSVRPLVSALDPARYVGVDLQAGPGVDEICDATDLVARFGPEAFDLLISTELLEHVRDWRTVISQFKQVLKPGGLLLVTTRSRGFPYHAYPGDFWRYEPADICAIFADLSLEKIESDSVNPGVFFKARKPRAFFETDTRQHALFSMITRRETVAVTDAQIAAFLRRGKMQRILRASSRFVRRLRDTFRS
jgi:SAM-dependent methyltransferase